MKRSNSNRVNMINSTTGFCDANTAATSGIALFGTVLGSVKTKMVLVNSYNQIAEGTTTGVTLDVKALRKAMTDIALKCANATLAYANATGNHTLAALVNYTESDLNRAKKEVVDDICQTIHDAANAHLAEVLNYGLTSTDVSDLQAAIDLYRTASQNTRQAVINRSQAKKNVTRMISEVVDDLLEGQLDKMANTLKLTDKNFVDGYKQSREIIDLGTTTAKVRGTVLDENDVPLRHVIFTIYEAGTTNEIAKTKTDVKGKFGIAKIPAGMVDFVWELEGYKTVTETEVKISAGKELKRKVVMDAAVVDGGNLNVGSIANIDLSGLNEGITKITVTAHGSTMRFYASANANDAPGGVYLDVLPGHTISKTPNDFGIAVGFGNGNSYLNVQNAGGGNGEWGIVFEK